MNADQSEKHQLALCWTTLLEFETYESITAFRNGTMVPQGHWAHQFISIEYLWLPPSMVWMYGVVAVVGKHVNSFEAMVSYTLWKRCTVEPCTRCFCEKRRTEGGNWSAMGLSGWRVLETI